jgi:hypothetical protein
VLIMDRAGLAQEQALELPECVTVAASAAVLARAQPGENLWHHLRSHHLSNRAYADYDHLCDAGTEAWRALTPEVIRSVCAARTSSARVS